MIKKVCFKGPSCDVDKWLETLPMSHPSSNVKPIIPITGSTRKRSVPLRVNKKSSQFFLKVLLSHENFCSTELRIPDTAELHIAEKNHKSCSDGIIPVDVETLTAGKPITKKNNYHTLQFMVQLVSSTLPAGSLAI